MKLYTKNILILSILFAIISLSIITLVSLTPEINKISENNNEAYADKQAKELYLLLHFNNNEIYTENHAKSEENFNDIENLSKNKFFDFEKSFVYSANSNKVDVTNNTDNDNSKMQFNNDFNPRTTLSGYEKYIGVTPEMKSSLWEITSWDTEGLKTSTSEDGDQVVDLQERFSTVIISTTNEHGTSYNGDYAPDRDF